VLAKDFVKAAKKKGVKNQEELRSILLAEAQSSLPTSEQVWAKAVIKSTIGYLREFFGVIKEDGTLAMATPNDPFEKELAALARVANMPNSVGSKTRILNNVLG
jgi:peroxiredoxin